VCVVLDLSTLVSYNVLYFHIFMFIILVTIVSITTFLHTWQVGKQKDTEFILCNAHPKLNLDPLASSFQNV